MPENIFSGLLPSKQKRMAEEKNWKYNTEFKREKNKLFDEQN